MQNSDLWKDHFPLVSLYSLMFDVKGQGLHCYAATQTEQGDFGKQGQKMFPQSKVLWINLILTVLSDALYS